MNHAARVADQSAAAWTIPLSGLAPRSTNITCAAMIAAMAVAAAMITLPAACVGDLIVAITKWSTGVTSMTSVWSRLPG